MSSPSSTCKPSQGGRSPQAVTMPSRPSPSVSAKQLPLPPPRRAPPLPTTTKKTQSFSPSLVQFSCQKRRPRFALNLFSIIRLTLVAALLTGIPLSVIQARRTEMSFLHSNVILKLVSLAFSLLLSTLDLVQFHYSKLPHRVEAMLDLLLAFSFLSFFVVGMITMGWTTDFIHFVISALHFFSFFNILVRSHRISQQLRNLSTLTLRDIEKAEDVSTRSSFLSAAKSTPRGQTRFSASEVRTDNTVTETITAIRSPYAELEGSNRWTIISEKQVDPK